MSEGVEVGDIRHEFVIELDGSEQEQLMADDQAAESEEEKLFLHRLLSIYCLQKGLHIGR